MENEWLMPGVFASRSRLSPKALRLYAANGVLVPNQIDPSNGYRSYHESQLRDARLVRMFRRLDMPLAYVAQILNAPREERVALVEAYWADVERKVAHQRELVQHLSFTLSGGKEKYPMHEIKTREVSEQLVLTEQAYVNAANLPSWIMNAGSRQLEEVTKYGGQTGPSLVIYHGEVSEDSDGPVEMCVPIPASMVPLTSMPSRIEPAHREVYTTVTRAQIRYPDIISTYDAVERWIAENGATVVGSPREVYFGDPSQCEIDEPVADIAFPIK